MSFQLMAWASEQSTGSPTRKAVLLALANRANHDTGQCNPSIERIAAETEYGERAVRQALADLCEAGLIARTRSRNADGSKGVYHYTFPLAAGAQPAARGAARARPGSRKSPAAAGAALEPGVLQDQALETDPPPTPPASDAVQRVYDHWRQARGKTRSSYDQISAARRQKIVSRLREFSEPDLIEAIDAVARDPWHERAHHDDLTVIFRSREQVDRFLEMAERTSTPYERAVGWLRTVGWQYSDEAIWEDLGKFGLTDEQRRELAVEAQRLQTERSAA